MRPGLNKTPIDILANLPAVAGPGSFLVCDPRGTSGVIFAGTSATGIYAIDTTSGAVQRLPNPPAGLAYGAGVCAVFDATGPDLYVVGPGAGGGVDSWFARLRTSTGVWTALNNATLDALLPGVISLDSALAHPCTQVGLAASDDFIYWTGGANAAASLIFARYGIGANTWAAVPPAARGVAAGAGCTLVWTWGYSPDRLLSLDGGGVGTAEEYGIAGNAWAAAAAVPPFADMPNTGTCACPSTDGSKMYFRLNATGGIYEWNRVTNAVSAIGQIYGPDGVATAGRKMAAYKVGTTEFLAVLVHGSTQVQRLRIVR